eukprot:725669_1
MSSWKERKAGKTDWIRFWKMQSEKQAKQDHATAIETIDEWRKQNAHLQSLVDDLINENDRFKSETIRLKKDKKEAVAEVDSLRTENEAVKRVHMKAMERMNQLARG